MDFLNRHRAIGSPLRPLWMATALCAAVFLQFALNRGGVESAIWIAGFFLGLQAVTGGFDLRQLPAPVWLFLAVILGLLTVSWVFHPQITDPGRTIRIVKFVILVLAVYYVASQARGTPPRAWIAALAIAIVLWQFAVRHLTGSPYGTFNNPHFLAYFTALLLPVLVLSVSWFARPYRYLILVVLLLALDLVFTDFHKPTIPLLAIAAGLGAFAWSIIGKRARWVIAGIATACLAIALVMSNHIQVTRVGLAAPSSDERVRIWTDTLRMLGDNDVRDWLVGNGIGSFRNEFTNYFPPEFDKLTLPHNQFLELLYENGVVVAALIFGLVLHVVWHSLRMSESLADGALRRLARCNLASLVIWFVFSFLAFGVYSRHTLYPLGFLLGIHFHLASVFARQENTSQAPPSGPARRDQEPRGVASSARLANGGAQIDLRSV